MDKLKTIKLKQQYIRELLAKIGVCDSVGIYFDDIKNIVSHHPKADIKLAKLKDFKIQNSILNKKALQLIIINDDDTITDISWLICASKKLKTNNDNLKAAFRNCILPQIEKFIEQNDTSKCQMCGIELNNNFHIDHIKMFKEIMEEFLCVYTGIVPSEFDDDIYYRAIFRKQDIDISSQFYEYHLHVAKLRCVCVKCNLTRTKK